VRKHLISFHRVEKDEVEKVVNKITHVEIVYPRRPSSSLHPSYQDRAISNQPTDKELSGQISALIEEPFIDELEDEKMKLEKIISANEKEIKKYLISRTSEKQMTTSPTPDINENHAAVSVSTNSDHGQRTKEIGDASRSTDRFYKLFNAIPSFQDTYEMILEPRLNMREGVTFSDPGKFGSFIMKLTVILSEKDLGSIVSGPDDGNYQQLNDELQERRLEGMINVYTNKISLGAMTNFMSSQLRFRGVIVRVNNFFLFFLRLSIHFFASFWLAFIVREYSGSRLTEW
jgi:hypothetical protein